MRAGLFVVLCALTAVQGSILDEDFYKRLAVEKGADTRAIRVAFKKLAMEYHPDKNPNDDQANAKMVELNEALTVLSDPDQRIAYDKGGVKGLKDAVKGNTGKGPKGGSQEFTFYESFGLYDSDPQVEVIDYHQWEASHYSEDAWIITFFSPRCSQCHDLADDWRRVGTELHGSFHVGAVNCDVDFPVCRAIGIQALPAVVLFQKGSPRNTKKPIYFSEKLEFDPLIKFAQANLPNVVQTLLPDNFMANSPLPYGGTKGETWVVGYCAAAESCEELGVKLKLVSMILNQLVPIAQVNCEAFGDLCKNQLQLDMSEDPFIITYEHAHQLKSSLTRDTREIAHEALRSLNALPVMEQSLLNEVSVNILSEGVRVHTVITNPREFLILFIDQETCDSSTAELGAGSSLCYQTLLNFRMLSNKLSVDWEYSDLTVTTFNCANGDDSARVLCEGLGVAGGEPAIILLKEGALNPNPYHDRIDRDEQVLAFVQEAYRSTVHELDHDDFEAHIVQEKQTWFVDFFAPWCHHCRDVWPEYNLASKHYDLPKDTEVHFGKINCEEHHEQCVEHHIRGYPQFLLFHEGVRHQYDFDLRTAEEFVRFIKETLEPVEYEFTPESYTKLIADPYNQADVPDEDSLEERWVVDFFAPWCSHCHVMSPKFREAAKALRGVVKFGKLNCELDSSYCLALGIRSYPTIWRFEPFQPRNRPTAEYPGLPDPKLILDFAMAEVPNLVKELSAKEFAETVKKADENYSWLVFFWSSKEKDCPECDRMLMKVQALASRYNARLDAMKRKVTKMDPVKNSKAIVLQFASINCRASGAEYTFCLKERIKKYPTLVYYSAANNEQRVIPGDDTLKVISEIDKYMASDRRALQHPFREQHNFYFHDEL